MATIDNLIKTRVDKLKSLRDKGIDPYPSRVNYDHTIQQARDRDGQDAVVVGRIVRQRGHGKIIFLDLVDKSAKIQIVIKADICRSEAFDLIGYLDIGDFISVQGVVGKTQSGEISIYANNLQIITKSIRPLPDKWHGLKDIEERYRKRYLDLILNSSVKKKLIIRSRTVDSIRDFLTNRGFLEVETPTLQAVYGGGFARPFITHHNELDADFYLRISDEMYLKRLIVGGFEKVFEITKVFRNEGIDHDHNPEFTMFEAQIAYKEYSYGMDIIEEIIENAAISVLGTAEVVYQNNILNFKRPWRRMKFIEAVKEIAGFDALKWKTADEAKRTLKEKIAKEKLKDLEKIKTLGELIAFAFEELVEEKLIQPTIVYDYPVEVCPLAKKCADPRFAQRFEMFAMGSELGNNYTELNDPVDLKQRFVEQKKMEEAGFDEAHQTDDDYLEAIEYGFPPTCGIAIGIDRLVMLLTDSHSLKEIIAFPTLKPLKTNNTDQVIVAKAKKADTKSPDLGINYAKAKEIANRYLTEQFTKLHSIESEAIMRALARHLKQDEEVWGIVGLLHDIDWDLTKNNVKDHTVKMTEILKKAGATDYLINTIQSHNYGDDSEENNDLRVEELNNKRRAQPVEFALTAAETLTGLIVASALVQPDKKLASVKPDSLIKKFKSKNFAAKCSRTRILECEKLGLSLEQFLEIGLKALRQIHEEIGL